MLGVLRLRLVQKNSSARSLCTRQLLRNTNFLSGPDLRASCGHGVTATLELQIFLKNPENVHELNGAPGSREQCDHRPSRRRQLGPAQSSIASVSKKCRAVRVKQNHVFRSCHQSLCLSLAQDGEFMQLFSEPVVVHYPTCSEHGSICMKTVFPHACCSQFPTHDPHQDYASI